MNKYLEEAKNMLKSIYGLANGQTMENYYTKDEIDALLNSQ